jgi:coenzyme F420-reducing hydrogenase delta subunit
LLCEVGPGGLDDPVVTVFVCANCARPSKTPEMSNRSRPSVPTFDWPFAVQEVMVSCAGRLQPEHVLKAFESGARLVCAVACSEDNCHHLEGSKRCARRVDYVRGLLDDIGLGAERLLLCHMPGTAAEDLALSAGRPGPVYDAEAAKEAVAAVRATVVATLETLTPTPLDNTISEAAPDPYQQVDTDYDDNDE